MQTFKVPAVILVAAMALISGACRDRASRRQPDEPQGSEIRVISLAPSLTEMIVAIGADDLLAGRSSACDYPAALLKSVPVVGGFGEPSLEALLARRPTLILDVALADKTLEHRMQAAGLRREQVVCRYLDDIPSAWRRIGQLLDRQAEAEVLAASLETALAGLRSAADSVPAADRPLVFVELWSEPLMTVGRNGFIAECIRLAGGENLGNEQDSDYYYISHERVIERNPDIIVLLYMAGREPAARIASRIGWENIEAVRRQRIHADFDHDTILRPGPRVLEGIAQLSAVIQPDNASGAENRP